MRRHSRETLLALLLLGVSVSSACSSDDEGKRPVPSAEAGTTGEAGSGDDGSGGDGTGAVGTGGRTPSEGGWDARGGEVATGAAPSAGEAGQAPIAEGGAGGARTTSPPEPPDLVTSSGGPWPDSLTGTCTNAVKLVPCPQDDDPFFGQDGSYRINVPKYTATENTLTDSITSLVWQVKPVTERTQEQAATYCADLDLGGQTDWRLPSRLEYITVLDYGFGNGAAMPPGIAIETLGDQWTSSAVGSVAGQFFSVNDQLGSWTLTTSDTPLGARCVRGATLTGDLTSDVDTATDAMTELVWQTSDLPEALVTWQQALEYCETLSHAERDDWRLPSIKELATLVDDAATSAPVIRAGLNGAAPNYWSSTPAASFGGDRFAMAIDTSSGYSPSFKMTESAAAARCVAGADTLETVSDGADTLETAAAGADTLETAATSN